MASTLSRAAQLLGLAEGDLAAAVARAGLEPWPERHADGSIVYQWRALLEAVQAAGLPIPDYAQRAHRWARDAAVRRRVGPDGKELWT